MCSMQDELFGPNREQLRAQEQAELQSSRVSHLHCSVFVCRFSHKLPTLRCGCRILCAPHAVLLRSARSASLLDFDCTSLARDRRTASVGERHKSNTRRFRPLAARMQELCMSPSIGCPSVAETRQMLAQRGEKISEIAERALCHATG